MQPRDVRRDRLAQLGKSQVLDVERLAALDGRDAGLGDLGIFRRLHAADAHRADALAVLHDGHAAFEQALHGRRAQEGHTALVDHVFVHLALAATQCGGVRLGGGNVRGDGRRAVQTLQPQQMTAIVHDGNGHGPLVLERFGFCSGGDALDVSEFEFKFGFHGMSFEAGHGINPLPAGTHCRRGLQNCPPPWAIPGCAHRLAPSGGV